MNEKIEYLKLGSIVCDYEYSVRMTIDTHTVNKYANNMKAGAKFPPIILEKDTKKIICGFNRYNAYKKVYDPDYEIPVILKKYKDNKELFVDAVKDNTCHGMPLTKWDIQNIISKAKEHNLDDRAIAELIGVPQNILEKWSDKTVIVVDEETGKEEKLVIKSKYKKGIDENRNGKITKTEYEMINEHGSGWSIGFHLNQIREILKIKSFSINKETLSLMESTANELTEFIKKNK